ncbi:MAG: hypothetical protein AAGF85_02060 [Bacteroidota bacterium]
MKSVTSWFKTATLILCSVAYSYSQSNDDGLSAYIILSELGYKEIPKSLAIHSEVRRLRISIDSGSWVILPPVSAWNRMIDQAKENPLPSSISSFTDLSFLDIAHLELTSLPKNFDLLQELDSLNIAFNYLIIENELPKLKRLKKLRYLNLVGNRIDTLQVEQWIHENPLIHIEYRMDGWR